MCIFEFELSRAQSTHWTCAIMVDTCNRNKAGVKAPTLRFHLVCPSILFVCVFGFVGLEEQHVVSNRCMAFLALSMDV